MYLVVFDATPGGANGGTLQVSSRDLSTPPQGEVTIDASGTVDPRTGNATLTGTVTCSNATSALLVIDGTQTFHGFYASGGELASVGPCDSQPHQWSIRLAAANGVRFVAQFPMTAAGIGYFCDEFDCNYWQGTQTVRLD
jgi:hypothetical protein